MSIHSSLQNWTIAIAYGIISRQKKFKVTKNTELSCKTCHLEKKNDYVTPILRSLHWLPVKRLIIFKILLLTYKVPNGLAPSYLCDLLEIRKHTRTLRSDSNNNVSLFIPRYFTETYGKRAFSICAPRVWNNLPPHLRSHGMKIEHFKKELKTFIFYSTEI